jgi:hypothetical protein
MHLVLLLKPNGDIEKHAWTVTVSAHAKLKHLSEAPVAHVVFAPTVPVLLMLGQFGMVPLRYRKRPTIVTTSTLLPRVRLSTELNVATTEMWQQSRLTNGKAAAYD